MYRAGGTRKAQYVVVLIVTATQITREPFGLVAQSDCRQPRGSDHRNNILVVSQVAAYSYLDSGDDWPFEGPHGPVTVRVRPTMHTNNGDTCLVGALLHQGIVLQPTFLVGPDIEAGRLVEVLPEYRSIENVNYLLAIKRVIGMAPLPTGAFYRACWTSKRPSQWEKRSNVNFWSTAMIGAPWGLAPAIGRGTCPPSRSAQCACVRLLTRVF
jgi:DNA-binding transcriptional LysR family regulator